MKALLIILMVVVVMAMAGWISFSRSNESATITVNKPKIDHDTKQVVEKGNELLHNAGVAGERAAENLKDEAEELGDSLKSEPAATPVQTTSPSSK